ncbi:MAG: protoheme IX farnesyltransferase [Hyphomicrobium sp.]|nr:protoheme IX farnesyltransferase [Hyphomicrobium sp.]
MTGGRARVRRRAVYIDRARDRVLLLKPRVMSLVVFTGAVGFAVAPGSVEPAVLGLTLLCMAAGAGACGALNMWYDADIDALMKRTVMRPIPRGTISGAEALAWGIVLSVLSVFTLGHYVNWTAGYLLALTIAIYMFVYTMGLKRRTTQNIVIGGASGALPPVIGWAAQTGVADWNALSLFLIIFLWTPPHFWALAMGRAQDYAKAGVPMLPCVAGARETCRQIQIYTGLLVFSTYLPVALGFEGVVYAGIATALNAVFVQRVIVLCRIDEGDAQTRAAFRVFGYSIFYLFALFVVLLTGAS